MTAKERAIALGLHQEVRNLLWEETPRKRKGQQGSKTGLSIDRGKTGHCELENPWDSHERVQFAPPVGSQEGLQLQ